ncbi:helix-turn-helix domain-containing protein [Burkholderia sp. Ax-1719]|uniref:IclR family transcriptional regulator n=1 Tax=Burkholderia sp. Ax-1719 TaxID=2608334 RepID=UPI00142015F6|nr:helix-turn-helix domain-containing protein [Burkholderia sp. Ax-1719]NIE62849.1 helix-turn-helix domain-containing protein [Burkholderia sp. Ax-1719]
MSHDAPVTLTLDRGLQVLRAFRANSAPLTDSELAQRTGLPRTAVVRLAATLLHLGYLRHAAGGTQFELASGVAGIGQAWLDADPIARAATPVIQALADKLGMAVALAVPDQLDMLTIAYGAPESVKSVESVDSMRAAACVESPRMGVGSLASMARTAIGHAWLWGLPEYERRRYFLRLLEVANTQAASLRKAIELSFEALREWGGCAVQETFEHVVYGSIALPLRAGQWRMPMALGVTTTDFSSDLANLRTGVLPDLSQAARELTVLLADIRVGPPGH